MEDLSSGKVTPENDEECKNIQENLEASEESGKVCQAKIEIIIDSPKETPSHSEAQSQDDQIKEKEEQHNLEMLQMLDTIKQLRAELEQKDSIIKLNERERIILEKEKVSVSNIISLS